MRLRGALKKILKTRVTYKLESNTDLIRIPITTNSVAIQQMPPKEVRAHDGVAQIVQVIVGDHDGLRVPGGA